MNNAKYNIILPPAAKEIPTSLLAVLAFQPMPQLSLFARRRETVDPQLQLHVTAEPPPNTCLTQYGVCVLSWQFHELEDLSHRLHPVPFNFF